MELFSSASLKDKAYSICFLLSTDVPDKKTKTTVFFFLSILCVCSIHPKVHWFQLKIESLICLTICSNLFF